VGGNELERSLLEVGSHQDQDKGSRTGWVKVVWLSGGVPSRKAHQERITVHMF
jgi:hypothetical protein